MVLRILKFSYLSLLTLSHPTLTYLTKPFLELSWGPSIKYIMLFLANFDPPPPVTLCHTSWDPQSMSHISDPPIFSRPSTKNPDKNPLYKLFAGVFQGAFSLEGFVRDGFCLFPFCQNTFVTTES